MLFFTQGYCAWGAVKPLQEESERVTGDEGRADESLGRPGTGTQDRLCQVSPCPPPLASGPKDGRSQDEQAGGGWLDRLQWPLRGKEGNHGGGGIYYGQNIREGGERRREVWAWYLHS